MDTDNRKIIVEAASYNFGIPTLPILSLTPTFVNRLLDIGCGDCTQTQYIKANTRLHTDISTKLMRRGVPIPFLLSDALDLDKFLIPYSFDFVVALDMIEHLEKEDGYKLIQVVERLSNQRMVFFTPLGNYCVGRTEEKYQCHLSAWLPDEFIELGYSCWIFPEFHGDGYGAFYAVKDLSYDIPEIFLKTEHPRWTENFWKRGL